jgi:hypothetical protein
MKHIAPQHRILAAGLVLASIPAQAQTMGGSYGIQIRQDAGLVQTHAQIYVKQRGLGATNLDQILSVPVPEAAASPSSGEWPYPIVSTDLPHDFRLSVINTDQVTDTVSTSKSVSSSLTILSNPTLIQLR